MQKLPLVDLTPQPAPAQAGDDFGPGQVGPGRKVRMHFALSLPDGELIDGNFGQKPVELRVGDGNLLAGFEQVMFGLAAGDKASFTLAPEQAFGAVNPDNVQRFPRHRFPPDLVLEPGLMVAFNDASGFEQAGVVVEHDKTLVTVDFNHPLAGRTVVFTVEILSVETA